MKRLLAVLALSVFVAGCSTTQTWQPQPLLEIDGKFEGKMALNDPNQAPPEHPAWRIADRMISVFGPAALPYLVTREVVRGQRDPVIVQPAAPEIVRPEIVTVPGAADD